MIRDPVIGENPKSLLHYSLVEPASAFHFRSIFQHALRSKVIGLPGISIPASISCHANACPCVCCCKEVLGRQTAHRGCIWEMAERKLQQRQAEGPAVRRKAVRIPFDALWGHVRDCAHPCLALGYRICQLPADTEIGDLEAACRVHEQVGGLDVPVDDAPILVQVLQPLHSLQLCHSLHQYHPNDCAGHNYISTHTCIRIAALSCCVAAIGQPAVMPSPASVTS